MPALFLENSHERLQPAELFNARGAPAVKTAFDALLLAEACHDRVTEYAGASDPLTAAAFVNCYFDLWDRVTEVHAAILEHALLTAEDQAFVKPYTARLPRDLAALKATTAERRAKSLASEHGTRGIQTALYWLRGDGKPSVGMFPLFQKDEPQTPKGRPPYGWLMMGRLLGANPRGPGGIYSIANELADKLPDTPALAAFRRYEDAKDSRDTLFAENALARAQAKRNYMREYQRQRRQAARELLNRERRTMLERDAAAKAEHEARMAHARDSLAPDPLS